MEQSKTAGPSLGAVVDWALKLGPVVLAATLWFFTLYANQASMLKHDADVDKRLATLETQANEKDRALVDRLAKMDSDIRSLTHDLQFYEQTQTRSNGK
jgi:hypothetical protein